MFVLIALLEFAENISKAII